MGSTSSSGGGAGRLVNDAAIVSCTLQRPKTNAARLDINVFAVLYAAVLAAFFQGDFV
jgi:hypothetical protein